MAAVRRLHFDLFKIGCDFLSRLDYSLGNQIHEAYAYAYVRLCSDVDDRYFATQYTPY
jgi:hypothetical protein